MKIPPVGAIVADAAIVFPCPILGVISYAIILVLGIVKAAVAEEECHASESDASITIPKRE